MKAKVLHTLKSHNMLKFGDKVIVALSGGADSVSLLSVLLELKDELRIEVFAAHVNHNLRGEESHRDEAFVRNLCKEKGVALYVESVDVKALTEVTGEGFETVGRRVRYDFFRELSEELDASVATAHTLSDALETALLNIARGSSISGLSAIPYTRGRIIRPLLDVTRQEVEAYVRDNSIAYVDDSTNADADICNRNKIRHKAVPVLKELNSSAEQNYLRLRQNLLDIEDYMTYASEHLLRSAKSEYGYDARFLDSAHPALKSFAIKTVIENSGAGYENKHIELIKDFLSSGGAVPLSGGYTAVVKQGILRVTRENSENQGEIPFDINVSFALNGKVYSVKELTEQEIVNKKLSLKVIGCDTISCDAVFASRAEGDRFALVRRGVTKNLRKLQNELKIPSEIRDNLLTLKSQGKILWAEGIGVSADGVYTKGKGILIEIREEV